METEQNSDKENKPTKKITDTEYNRLKAESERLRQTQDELRKTQKRLRETQTDHKKLIETQETLLEDVLEQHKSEITKVYQEATTDSITEIPNRIYFDDYFKKYVSEAKRYGRPLSFIIFDINNFKSVNDDPDLGHPGGDFVLKGLARLVKESIRESDFLARLGGDEFGLVLPETDEENAYILAEVIRDLVERYFFIYNNKTVKITITLGVKEYSGETAQKFYEETDKAFFVGQYLGKNCTVKYSDYEKNWIDKLHKQNKQDEEDFENF